jgi:hypothetical protein
MDKCASCSSPLSPGRCKTCRRNEYYLKQGLTLDTCRRCMITTRLYTNQECRQCLEDQALRECRLCHEIKAEFLSFEPKQAVCRDCRLPLAHLGPSIQRKHASLKRYGLTYDQYVRLVVAQQGLCAICRKRPRYALAVDHDHQTGKVRGLLCHGCNIGIGNLKDSVDVLDRARAYLIAGGSVNTCLADEPLITAERQAAFDKLVFFLEAEALKENLAHAEATLHAERLENAQLGPDMVRALALALKRELEAKKPSQSRDRGLSWLAGLLGKTTSVSSPGPGC